MRKPLLALAALFAAGTAPVHAASPQQPAVVELFTSQGCSSCPPANAAVTAIADRPDVLALSFGVTYWDQLGWTDTFAHAAFTNRQHRYASWFKRDQVYTPQVVVNGRVHSVGNRKALLEQLIARNERKGGPLVRLTRDAVTVAAGATPGGDAEVWMVRYDPRTIPVPIRRGENGGRTLPHRNVVRELVKVGTWSGPEGRYALPGPTRAGLRTAILVQSAQTGAIVAAAKG
ncbi:MAG: DUF1223 domain-containing protein [Proteobacteria bacterium]|nr:DUF1223 domain-containing protein [Pseudomonadota bacterium]